MGLGGVSSGFSVVPLNTSHVGSGLEEALGLVGFRV